MKVCVRCGKEKSISSFHNSKRFNDKKNSVCAICINNDNRERRVLQKEPERKIKVDYRSPPPSMKDYCRAMEILSMMGYDLTKNIHEQFCEKFNLPQKEFPTQNFLKWKLEDCINNEQ